MNASAILNADKLLAAAKSATGFANSDGNACWGDDTFVERFHLAVKQLQSFGMDAAGQQKSAEVCHWLLTSRLQFFDDHKRYSLEEEKIERPLFATGEPRAGTTLLHALLSVDPHARALRFWEVMYPSPPPGFAKDDDPRRARADADWREILEKLPFWLISHPYNDMLGNGLPECERTWAFDFRVMTPTAWWRVPMGMVIGGLPTDARAQYRIHKMMLQHCQASLSKQGQASLLKQDQAKKYWVLKGFHSMRLKELFETYPDARIIWTHRDPVQTIASRIVLTGELVEGLSGHVDWKAQAKLQLAASRASFNATMNNPLIDDPRIHHVRYPDFVADPVGTIRGYYEFAGVPFKSDTETAMRNYLRDNKGDRYGKFNYSTAIINEDIDALHAEFEPYRKRFNLEIEQRR